MERAIRVLRRKLRCLSNYMAVGNNRIKRTGRRQLVYGNPRAKALETQIRGTYDQWGHRIYPGPKPQNQSEWAAICNAIRRKSVFDEVNKAWAKAVDADGR